MDRLSELHDVLIEKILLNIPFFDAVRTCVLSKHWQYKWTMLPKLLLDFSFILKAKAIKEEPPFDYVHIVNRILTQRTGPLNELYLAIPDLPYLQIDDISQAVCAVEMTSIKKITILNWGAQRYSWPLYNPISPNLTYLELRYCELKQEPFSRGFPNLATLVFDKVECDSGTLSSCISNSPKLEKIILENVDFNDHALIICAPKLECLFVRGVCKCIYLPKANNLREMELHLLVTQVQWWDKQDLIDFFGSLSLLESLSLDAHIYSLFVGLQEALPRNLSQLRVLRLTYADFWNKDMLRVFLCIIHSSPCLQRLEIIPHSIGFRRRRRTISVTMYDDSTLVHLKEVYIGPISGSKNELSVIQNLLRCSPALQEMSIYVKCPNCAAFNKALIRFRRASPTVVIKVFTDYQDNFFQT